MHRFILRENASHFRKLLETEDNTDRCRILQAMLDSVEAELTELEEASARAQVAKDAQVANFLNTLLRHTAEIERADFGNIQLYEPEHECLLIAAQLNFQRPFLDHFTTVTNGDGSACGKALEGCSAVWIEDVRDEAAFRPHLDIASETGFRAVQSIPLVTSGRAIGIVSIHFRQPRSWSLEERQESQRHAQYLCDLISTRLSLPDYYGALSFKK
ncbi:GAF domain-containing protein [Labrys sp. ZIDIC5]|uniref:GAF domain-containing protein n=1 Tax=Labrys sedimenti TaxID=3106036 RepID=UPI002ACAF55D|nr:GAF domain-containing protein [Labrys sp. ZIDIC5]MDZ5454462.1 GAF domain-containing protein [Labrys sp. ZIDIC5]